MKKIISLITLLSFTLQAAIITDDKTTIGKKSSSSAKELIFDTNNGTSNKKFSLDATTKKMSLTSDEFILGDGTQSDKIWTVNRGGSNPVIKWNETTDKLTFSNDGSTFKNFGSGSGSGGSSGVNLLANESFEDAVAGVLSDWTNSGGTFTQQTYTNNSDSDEKYFRFVASGAGQYFEMVKVVPTNFAGGGCQIDFKKLNIATADLFKVEALDNSNNVLATGNVKVLSWQKFPALSFPCPAAGANVKIRVTSLAAGTLEGDRAYLGSNQNLVYTSQARLLGTITWATTVSCSWTVTSTSLASFPADTDCPAPTVTGELIAPATKIPGFTLANYRKGDYKLEAKGKFFESTSGTNAAFRFTDGTLFSKGTNSIVSSANQIAMGFIGGEISNATDQGSTTFNIQGSSNSGTVQIENDSANTSLSISVWYYPQASDVAVSPEQNNWFIDANIGGANPTGAAASSYTEITSASLDMVLNSGSATAEIPCSTTNASTGLTCSAGSESVGVAFVPPMPGRYKVCASYGGNDAGGTATYQLIETPNNAQTITQESNTRMKVTASAGATFPQALCGFFNFSDTAKKTIRLMQESNASGVTILANRDASLGQNDIHITVENVQFPQSRPILVGGQSAVPGLSNGRADLLNFTYGDVAGSSSCTTGTCTMTQSGTGVTSVVWNSTGSYTTTFARTYTKIFCNANVRIYGTSNGSVNPSGLTCSNCSTLTFLTTNNSDTASNTGGIFNCTGIY